MPTPLERSAATANGAVTIKEERMIGQCRVTSAIAMTMIERHDGEVIGDDSAAHVAVRTGDQTDADDADDQ